VTGISGSKFDINQAGTHTLVHMPRNADASKTQLKIEATIKELIPNWCAGLWIQSLKFQGTMLEDMNTVLFTTESQEANTTVKPRAIMNGREGDPAEIFAREHTEKKHNHPKGQPSTQEDSQKPWALVRKDAHVYNKYHKETAQASTQQFVDLHIGGATFVIEYKTEGIRRKGGTTLINYLNIVGTNLHTLADNMPIQNIGGLLGSDDHTWAEAKPQQCKERALKSLNEEFLEQPTSSTMSFEM